MTVRSLFNLYVDLIIQPHPGKIILINRGVAPYGWALPGGMVDPSEPLWQAAEREALEETTLRVHLREQFFTYSFINPNGACIGSTTVFLATAVGTARGQSDALEARAFAIDQLPEVIEDHKPIIEDFRAYLESYERPHGHRSIRSNNAAGANAIVLQNQERKAA